MSNNNNSDNTGRCASAPKTAEARQLELLTSVTPSRRQMDWQRLEFTAFFHYGVNSFTDREWGDGTESEGIFAPNALDTDQWCESLQLAGIRACIITAKHHDGFCLWDTAYTTHSVMHSPCKRDIVAELSASCRKYGIRFGVYLSPWDRHEATYGQGKPYDDYFCNQLTELLTKYGPLYTVWFDGACGEGPNGKKQQYDWNRYYELIRRYQPDAVISVTGPDVRWCGNEAGDCRESEWSVVPARLFSQKNIAAASQQSDSAAFRVKKIDEQDRDLGSREAIGDETELIWYPAEVDTSIRPGWFHHDSEDCAVRPLKDLIRIYLNSVGGNSVLLLNIPPHRNGYITEADRTRLKELGDFIRSSFSDIAAEYPGESGAKNPAGAAAAAPGPVPGSLKEACPDCASDFGEISFTFDAPTDLGYMVIAEDLAFSQRVEAFTVRVDGEVLCHGTTIGYKKIVGINRKGCRKVSITFDASRKEPHIRQAVICRPGHEAAR